MTIIFMLMAVAVLVGFALSFYVFFYRLRLTALWRWLGGIFGGLITGLFMALLVLLILWPPVLDFVTLGGLGIIVVTIGTVLTVGPDKEMSKQYIGEYDMLDTNVLLSGAGPTTKENDQ